MTDRRNKMLAAVFQGPGQMEVTEVDTPDIGADEVLVKVGANTICGTDVRIFRGEKTKGIHPPTILGHEMAGHIYQVGKQGRGYEVGGGTVIVRDRSGTRRAVASGFGADISVDPTAEDLPSLVSEVTGGLGADSIIICIGVPTLVNDALNMAHQGARINIFAGLAAKGWAEIEANLIHYKELEVTGSANSRRPYYQTALQLIESGRIKVEQMVTDRFPLRSAREALDKVASGEGLKIAVLP